ncbi:hypothetical protein PR202_ga28646 [Eleusine coracana subsp. coracana]|uniref:Disease resistance N-terminal domain-containing protein n=1 Tax=Eleusine coracana subsp. coracana TaxID=191504 RepID=A0AAV5DJY7_ELECO|nr:hypothetical protein PR202_ga28646 [Eleusine coracana subsp. coracana]
MVGFVAGLIASAAVKISSDKLCSALSEQAGLLWNFRKDLEDMKDTMESIAAVLKDAEKQSVKNESVRVWLKRLKHAALDISDMMDDYQDATTQPTAKRYSEFKDISNKGELERIGLDIANKCGGVPLAAQALGYMLKSKDLHGWTEVKNSDIWNESSGVDDSQDMKVLPSLKLSFERMAPILRLCFSYCAIYSKGHDIYEDDLVHQWIALDFIKKPSEAKAYIKQLMGMSFLEHSKLPSVYYTKCNRTSI